ncbi:MAG: DoxX family membrane protein [Streptococcaceae bacterium]|jgi:thiosulfate dehydrogenase [quinone] large subunit|nr:DoxX family membrane protein [Streptococcaceae bacterium]
MISFLRQNRIAMLLLTVLRVFIGIQWLSAAFNKLLTPESFSASGLIQGALAQESAYPWFQDFLSLTTANGTNTQLFDTLVPLGQLLVGIALLTGTFTLLAASAGLLMNASFILSGVISENPTFIVIQVLLLIAGTNASKLGGDFFLQPWLRRQFSRLNGKQKTLA